MKRITRDSLKISFGSGESVGVVVGKNLLIAVFGVIMVFLNF
jgi:hypothetical protein